LREDALIVETSCCKERVGRTQVATTGGSRTKLQKFGLKKEKKIKIDNC
jgi:hypothetical protein